MEFIQYYKNVNVHFFLGTLVFGKINEFPEKRSKGVGVANPALRVQIKKGLRAV